MPSLRDAYASFLASADLTTWRRCLARYEPAVDMSRPYVLSDRDLAEGLCISIYVQWLSGLCGEEDVRSHAQQQRKQLADVAQRRAAGSDASPDVLLAKAIIAAGCGYPRTTEDILQAHHGGDLPVEIALLVLPPSALKRAQLLKTYTKQAGSDQFLPALYFYVQALLDLGYYEQVRNLLPRHGPASRNPLVIDLQGKLFELTGAWTDARDAYQVEADDAARHGGSEWPVHKYRRRICEIIVNRSAAIGADSLAATVDDKLRVGMEMFDREADQMEAVRTSSFVNACRWHDFGNWLVDYELGKLCFRRRRHAEAERHLRAAAKQAPSAFLLPIHQLRFTNITWLGGGSIGRDLPLRPETLECGFAAIDAPGGEAEKAYIRRYIAGVTHDFEVLRPVFEAAGPYDLAEAHHLRGDTPAAMQAWCTALGVHYHARTVHHLIEFFASCQFDQTVSYLVELVTRESWDDFFDIWEIASIVQRVLQQRGAHHNSPLEAQLMTIERRLEELSQTEFQHAIRAVEFFTERRRTDIAAALLRRASRLAESPEEYLQLAMAQRSVLPGEQDLLGVDSLLSAERESTDRLERLQIARAWARYGQMQRARSILRAEGVFDAAQMFEPIEYVVILQCGQPCLSASELADISTRAEGALRQELLTGAFGRHGNEFVQRLKDHASTITLSTTAGVEKGLGHDEDSVWHSLKSSLERSKHFTDLEEEQRLLKEMVLRERTRESLFLRYTVWEYAFRNLEALVEGIQGLRPPVDLAQTPISRSELVLASPRARQLAELWRAYLMSADRADRARQWQAIEKFYEDERALTVEWDALRVREQAVPLARTAMLARHAADLLASIGETEQNDSPWPFFLDLRRHIVGDAERLGELLVARIGTGAA